MSASKPVVQTERQLAEQPLQVSSSAGAVQQTSSVNKSDQKQMVVNQQSKLIAGKKLAVALQAIQNSASPTEQHLIRALLSQFGPEGALASDASQKRGDQWSLQDARVNHDFAAESGKKLKNRLGSDADLIQMLEENARQSLSGIEGARLQNSGSKQYVQSAGYSKLSGVSSIGSIDDVLFSKYKEQLLRLRLAREGNLSYFTLLEGSRSDFKPLYVGKASVVESMLAELNSANPLIQQREQISSDISGAGQAAEAHSGFNSNKLTLASGTSTFSERVRTSQLSSNSTPLKQSFADCALQKQSHADWAAKQASSLHKDLQIGVSSKCGHDSLRGLRDGATNMIKNPWVWQFKAVDPPPFGDA